MSHFGGGSSRAKLGSLFEHFHSFQLVKNLVSLEEGKVDIPDIVFSHGLEVHVHSLSIHNCEVQLDFVSLCLNVEPDIGREVEDIDVLVGSISSFGCAGIGHI